MAKSVLIVLLSLVLTGCGLTSRHFGIAYGNFEFSQGRFSQAADRYARVHAATEDNDLDQLISYNTASVRYAIGDVDSAVSYWTSSEESEDALVRFRSAYNLGVLLFQQGRYRQAYEQFRSALRIEPGDADTQHNLELAFNRWQNTSQSQSEGATESRETLSPDAEGLLEEIRRRNADQFRVRTDPTPGSDVNDW
ncbi:MAG: tetratricopeptide repeat protein [Spirochaetota bacterium]